MRGGGGRKRGCREGEGQENGEEGMGGRWEDTGSKGLLGGKRGEGRGWEG